MFIARAAVMKNLAPLAAEYSSMSLLKKLEEYLCFQAINISRLTALNYSSHSSQTPWRDSLPLPNVCLTLSQARN